MQRALPAVLALAALLCPCRADTHPVTRVVGLLQALHDKVKDQGKAEEVTYAQFDSWCANSIKSLDKAITSGKDTIDTLESKVESKTREEQTLTSQITALTDEIAKHTAAGTAADKVRSDAAALYSTADKDLADTVAAISQAITALEGSRPAALAQARSVLSMPLVLEQLTDDQQQLLDQTVSDANAQLAAAAPAAAPAAASTPRPDLLAKGDYQAREKKYTFKSGSVIELLKELKTKFEDDRLEGTKAETNSQNAFDLAKAARDNAISAAGNTKTEKTTLRGDVQSELATATSTLKDTKADLKADTDALSSTEQSCTMKKSEWTERQEIRAREMKAIQAGIEILAQVTGVRTTKPSNPVPPPSPVTMLLQNEDPRARVVNFLRKEAREVHSRAFARFAEELAARVSGPFDEVNNMIQKMIFRLMAEQKDEDEHKNWCDMELDKSNISKSDKEAKIQTLNAKLTDTKATIQLLTNEMSAADKMVASIVQHLEEATKIRQVGRAENKQAVQDAKDAQQAIAEAEAVLLEFYKDTGMVAKEAWELLQRGGAPVTLPAEPSTWSASYTGVTDPTKQPEGIITVLKTISADFATMEAETLAQEETDQKTYDDEVKTLEIEKARRAKESEMKSQEKKRLEDKVVSLTSSVKHVTGELGAVEQYLKDLGPACIQGDSTYAARKAARDQEITALKEAQVTLADWQSGKGNSTGNATAFLMPIKPVNFLRGSQ
mmetsp:Transcript_35212/g.109642  ORF Transcript_35212/g.109642 Transcript_35212/m.109642 type:complete len:725 (+) Transcript_35212:53-2227(+)